MIRSKISGIILVMFTVVLMAFPALPVLAASDGGGTPLANSWLALLIALAIIVLDTILGILLSIKEGQFDWRELPRFLQTAILPSLTLREEKKARKPPKKGCCELFMI